MLVRSADDAPPLIAHGSWEGRIATAPRGSGGFGYDPVFVPRVGSSAPPRSSSAREKNAVSHRGQALRALVAMLGSAKLYFPPMKHGRLFVIAAPSGAGKTSLVKALLASEPRLRLSVSHTTRKRRPTEEDGREYHFVTVPQFERWWRAASFSSTRGCSTTSTAPRAASSTSSCARATTWCWRSTGRARSRCASHAASAAASSSCRPRARALAERLARRATDSAEVIARRLRDAAADMSHYREFDYVVVNDDFEQAVSDLRRIVAGRGEDLRSERPALTALLAELLAPLRKRARVACVAAVAAL